MIDSVLNLLFRCSHRRLTRPITPVKKRGEADGGTYVVCLDCGKQFSYDPVRMHIGAAIERSADGGVLPPNLPKPRKTKVRYAFLAAVPVGVVIGALLKGKNAKVADPRGPSSGEPQSTPAQPGDAVRQRTI